VTAFDCPGGCPIPYVMARRSESIWLAKYTSDDVSLYVAELYAIVALMFTRLLIENFFALNILFSGQSTMVFVLYLLIERRSIEWMSRRHSTKWMV
jgi:hypothetical protein